MRLLPNRSTPLHGIFLIAAFATGALEQTALAQASLTTIQDTLFKADGTRFTGALTIQWNTFNAANLGAVIQQSQVVNVVNGNLMVQLAPNAAAAAPANTYTVHYQSDGNQQFTESWTVPSSVIPLTVAQVRTGMITSSNLTNGNQTAISESTVVGLVADLSQRPVKGPAFGPGSVAVINQNGQIDTAIGAVGDCVMVDGTTGPCGGLVPQFFDAETPAGLVDGSNATFTLSHAPTGSSLMLFRNGVYMKGGFDYSLNGATIQFVAAAIPMPGDTLMASYRIDPPGSNTGSSPNSPQLQNRPAVQVLCSANGLLSAANVFQSLGSCDVPAAGMNPGDRIEIRFSFAHANTASGFDIAVNWGGSPILTRHAGAQDSALVGQADVAIGPSAAEVSTQSWGTVLNFLPGILTIPAASGVKIDFQGQLSAAGPDTLTLQNFTVIRYPAN
ncbi:MAG TPA: hypothetical protein VKB79_13395 [Bryobacteraceae bacterium]|nr:hypothetical protein [Bryobacteraceae bacterium]